jgi:hypothetical protein
MSRATSEWTFRTVAQSAVKRSSNAPPRVKGRRAATRGAARVNPAALVPFVSISVALLTTRASEGALTSQERDCA